MTTPHDFVAIVLAAGQGTRMKSDKPKVLHELCGRPMAFFPIDAALRAGATQVVAVVGHGRALVEESLRKYFDGLQTAHQPLQKGTGDAVRCGLEGLEHFRGWVLILHGDCPLLHRGVMEALLNTARASGKSLALATSRLPDPSGYGRILRNSAGEVIGIREHRDCSPDELKIDEVNPAVYAVEANFLRQAIAQLSTDNAQGELYLTDIVARAAAAQSIVSVDWPIEDLRGVNDRYELALCDQLLRRRIAREHALTGVTLRDPDTAFFDFGVRIGHDSVIDANVVLRGNTSIGSRAVIGFGTVLDDVIVGDGAVLKPYTVATRSRIGSAAQIGPFSHLRPDTDLADDVHIGNFVETKKTKIARGAKANHLAYLGDGIIGEKVNVGAGTIFCNYDGFNKHVTVLEDGAFIGSDSQLVAPVRVGKNSYVATGTTVTRDVPEDALALSRVKQVNKDNYATKLRERMKALKESKK